jgi:hypothetical protein
VFAVGECQVRSEHVCLLGCRDDDRVERVRVVEDLSQIVERLGFRIALRRFVQRDLIDVTEDDDVLVRMRRGWRGVGAAATSA